MRVVIVGPGALGGLLAATMSMGNDGSDTVCLLDYNHRLARVIERMQSAGMNAATTESIRTRVWAKLFINVGINALTVIYDCRNGELLDIPEAQLQMRQAIEEAHQVARSEQISVIAHWRDTLEVCRATATNISSMLQDVRKKRKTEIDAINGEIVRLAERHGLSAPMNVELVRKVKDIEQRYE